MPRPKKPVRQRARPKHTFIFEIDWHDGRGPQKIISKAKVIPAKRPVELEFTVGDIQESIDVHGCGNSMLCAVSQSVKRQKRLFPHPFTGAIDWFYKTAFVATKMGPNGLPIECVKYEHRDAIARDFDKEAGQRRLLKRAQDNGGVLVLKLLPARDRVGESKLGGHSRNAPESRKRLRTSAWGKGNKQSRRFAEMVAGRGLSLRAAAEAAA